jgi:hypothetical protein
VDGDQTLCILRALASITAIIRNLTIANRTRRR